ncbi:MAG: porin [Rhizobacter sp.]|nr:porin [Rhizobacter sp.]
MNRTILFAALATLSAGTTFAQSEVSLYGRLNTSLERQKVGTASATSVLQNNASRLGFKGSEDLGGGLKAGFQLEHGFNVDNGAQTQANFWARQSEFNLGGAFGTVRVGNFTSEAYYATADYVSLHNHDTGTSSDALYAYIGRNTNKIGYRAPEFTPGLSLEAAASLSEGAANTDRSYDLAANYAKGPLQLGAGYEKNGNQNQFAARGLYEIGAFTVGGYVQRDKNGFASGSRTTLRLSGMYLMGLHEIHANVGRAGDYGNVANSSATQYTLGYNYNLSKRTKAFAFYTKLNDSAAAVYGGDFSSIALGMRHNF